MAVTRTLLLVVAVCAGVWAITTFILERRESARRADCANNMRQIGLELHMRAANDRGEFPASLSKLRAYAKDPNLHLCPSFKPALPLPLHRHELDRYGSYFYVAGLTESNSRRDCSVLLFDAPDNHSKHGRPGGNIMTMDGYIQWCPVDSDDPYETRFWDFLARDGITKDKVLNAKDRIIQVDQLEPALLGP